MRRLLSALILLTFTSVACRGRAGNPDSGHEKLFGTWRLVSYENVENGRKIYRYGQKPLGLFIYTADGHVAIQIANAANPACVAPVPTVFASDERIRAESQLPECTPEQLRQLVDGYVAYWGTYSVDESAGVLIHHVESDFKGGTIGTDQRRPFRLEGDRLVIGGPSNTRVLERVR